MTKTTWTPPNNLLRIFSNCMQGFNPPPKMTVSQHAERTRRLSKTVSNEAGLWRNSRTPYLVEPMDMYTDPRVHEITIVAPAQSGKTEVILNIENYIIDIRPKGIMHVLPSDDSAKDFSVRRITPFIADNPQVKNQMGAVNGLFKKQFAGGCTWTITGANVPSDVCSAPCETCLIDEYDRTGASCGNEGEVRAIIKARMTTFPNRKLITVSTPTLKGASKVEKVYNQGTREIWEHKCKKCEKYSNIVFKRDIKIKYELQTVEGVSNYDIQEVYTVCPHCGEKMTEAEVKNAPQRWRARNPKALEIGGHVSYWLSGFYSPWIQWRTISLEYLQAGKDFEALKATYNTRFCELWETYGGQAMDETELMKRREIYDSDLPEGVLYLTAGVDTQDNRLEYEVVGWGFHKESWGIARGSIVGYPDRPETWEKLDTVLDKEYRFKNGKALTVGVTFVDSGGHYTPDVRRACRNRQYKNVFAIKGVGYSDLNATAPLVSRPKIVYVEKDDPTEQCFYFYLNVNDGKSFVMNSLKIKSAGEMYSHFPKNEDAGYNADYFSGLLSEVEVIKNNRVEWKKLQGHERNEPLDCRNYAYCAFMAQPVDLEKQYKLINDLDIIDNADNNSLDEEVSTNSYSGASMDWE